MKRVLALVLVLFTLFIAPLIPDLRTRDKPVPALALGANIVADEDDPKEILKQLLSHGPATITIPKVRPVLDPGEKYVPVIILSTAVTKTSTDALIAAIAEENRLEADAIVFEINSQGGSVDYGFDLVRAMERSKAPIQCVVDADAQSMAFYILQACNTRFMTKRSKLMVHEPIRAIEGYNYPTAIKNVYESMRTLNLGMTEHEGRRLRVSVTELRHRIAGGVCWYMDWEDALHYGAVDGIVTSVEDVVQAYAHGHVPKRIK